MNDFYRGEQSPTDSEIEIADLKAEVARLMVERDADRDWWRASGDPLPSSHHGQRIAAEEREVCLDIVAGFAREAAYSGERHVLMLVAQAIRDRK